MYPFAWRTSNSFFCARSTKSNVLTWIAATGLPSFLSRYARSGSNRSRFSSSELQTWNATRRGVRGGARAPLTTTAAVPAMRRKKTIRDSLLNLDDPQPRRHAPVVDRVLPSPRPAGHGRAAQGHRRGPAELDGVTSEARQGPAVQLHFPGRRAQGVEEPPF